MVIHEGAHRLNSKCCNSYWLPGLRKVDQPLVMDYIHRLCKDVPVFFKVATRRHSSVLYLDYKEQPIGAQERHDYQPINIDFSFIDFNRTVDQNKRILYGLGAIVGIANTEIDSLFKGEGFERLVMAGGGVPRDCLSLFLEVVSAVQSNDDKRIGKDEVRVFSRTNFERRIEELKKDSIGEEQALLIRAIYVIRQFCVLHKKINMMLIPDKTLQENQGMHGLIYRLLDARIIHHAGTAITHKSQQGTTYEAFVLDIGSYAHMRVLHSKFNEIDLSEIEAKEKMRSAPILDEKEFKHMWEATPENLEEGLLGQDTSEAKEEGETKIQDTLF